MAQNITLLDPLLYFPLALRVAFNKTFISLLRLML